MRIRLKELRMARCWTQKKASEELGIPIDTIKSIETNRSFVSKKTLQIIYTKFECKSMDEVIDMQAS